MFKPKQEVKRILSTLNCWVSQTEPEKLTELPAVIFKCANNAINPDLDNDIDTQDIAIIIDIYAKKSSDCTNLFEQVEQIMRNNLYRATFSSDEVPARPGMKRINARFEKIV